jgi:hypothetical protein
MVLGSLAGSIRWLNRFSDGLKGYLKKNNGGLGFGGRYFSTVELSLSDTVFKLYFFNG